MRTPGLQRLEQKIHKAFIALANSSDKEIAQLLAQYGYTVTKIATGKELLLALKKTILSLAKEYGEQYQATKEVEILWSHVNNVYGTTRKIARIAFRNNPSAMTALGLTGRRQQTLTGIIPQAQLFYDNVAPTFLESMESFGYTTDKLLEEGTIVEQLVSAVHAQNKEMGEAQQATKSRDEQMEKSFEWMSDFYAVAKIALAGKPQLREKLGMLERS